MQSRPRRQMQDERAAGVLVKFKLNPGVVSVQMDANHASRPATTAGDERPLIERGEPTVRHSHLIVQTERSWRRWRVLRRKETGGVSVNGRKLHDSSVCVAVCVRCAPITADGCVGVLGEKRCRIVWISRRGTSEANDEAKGSGAVRPQNWRIWSRNLFSRAGFPQDLHAPSTSFPHPPMSLEWRRVLVSSRPGSVKEE